ncbi:ATP-dependent RNA helicase [Salix suchowensis]|nr:ATP-dependent RNA helicase [Salix suchowensis]
MIAVTQPRRVAATSLAARVAAEQNVKVGATVGYSVRFDERSGPDTRIKYLTDGMIVRELLSDPLLSRYSVIIVDEAHERTLRTDLLLASLKGIQKYRSQPSDAKGKGRASLLNPLKIVIMSATLDAEKFSKFLNNAPIEYIQGRQHPVQIFHSAEGQSDYLAAALRVFFQVHTDQGPGMFSFSYQVYLSTLHVSFIRPSSSDILPPGQDDIESLEKSIRLYANQLPHKSMEVVICPMYAAQAAGQNSKVFNVAPPNTRKCILATNIAETSITVPGVKYVIDTGKCKEKYYLARETGGGFDTLLTRDITKSSANQRAGRAGREGSGVCFRLYTEAAYNNMAVSADPEIRRCSLTSSVLQLKCLGQDFQELDFMDKPDYDSGTDADGAPDGCLPSRPLLCTDRPRVQGIQLRARDLRDRLCPLCLIKAVRRRQRPTRFSRGVAAQVPPSDGDHLTILGVVKAYQEIALVENKAGRREWCRKHFLNERALLEARDIRDQLKQTCARYGISFDEGVRADNNNDDAVLKALAHGLVLNSALLQPDGATYKQTMGHTTVKIHPSSALSDRKHPAIIFNELVGLFLCRPYSTLSDRVAMLGVHQPSLRSWGLVDTQKFLLVNTHA